MSRSVHFRAFYEGELPNLELRSSRDEALHDAMIRAREAAGEGGKLPVINIQQVRAPAMSDFFSLHVLISEMRESMAETIGNDDALSDASMVQAFGAAVEAPIRRALDQAAETVGLRLDGLIVVSSELYREDDEA